jgi:hypothetical protein
MINSEIHKIALLKKIKDMAEGFCGRTLDVGTEYELVSELKKIVHEYHMETGVDCSDHVRISMGSGLYIAILVFDGEVTLTP